MQHGPVWKCVFLCLNLFGLLTVPATAQLIPGELPVNAGRELTDRDQLPTLNEIIAAARNPEPSIVTVIRLHHDEDNHYAPEWSPQARRILFLRSNLEQQVSKVVCLPNLNSTKPFTVYDDTFTYEHMARWSLGSNSGILFSTSNTPTRAEAIHFTTGQGKEVSLTDAAQSTIFPWMWQDKDNVRLVCRRNKSLLSVSGKMDPLPFSDDRLASMGDADEVSMSRDGRLLAIVKTSNVSVGHMLIRREIVTSREEVLWSPSDRYIRNPVWSSDGSTLAFYSRKLTSQNWELWSLPLRDPASLQRIAENVYVQEDFANVGPAWGGESSRLWYFAEQNDGAARPLLWTDTSRKTSGTLEYPPALTLAKDVHASPSPDLPALAFVAVQDRALDVFVAILNRN